MASPAPSEPAAPAPPTFREALVWWLKLGFISFGGPAGQIALMHQELVERRRWISERRFLHALDYCMVLPGPEAQQLATYIGWLMHRAGGGIAAGALFVLPSLAILIALSWIYVAYGDVPAIAGAFYGIKPAVVAIVAFPLPWRLASRALVNGWLVSDRPPRTRLRSRCSICPSRLVVARRGRRLGLQSAARCGPAASRLRSAHKAARRARRALIDDDTPTPAHATFSRARFGRVLFGPRSRSGRAMAALGGWLRLRCRADADGRGSSPRPRCLTFGGAYAVLPYVFQGACRAAPLAERAQMIDGLALGESTPGPLIMVVAFVGFVGGWTKAVLGADALFLSGVVAATVVTFFTFLPSFCFILLGGPLVESTHGDLRFTAPLTAITAAVVA
jgi:chromate transporter